jgi:hypothetical protein
MQGYIKRTMLTDLPRKIAKVLSPGTEAFTSNASGSMGEYRASTYQEPITPRKTKVARPSTDPF